MTYIATPGLTEYTVVFRAHPRPDGAKSFRTIYAYTLEEAAKGIYHLPNANNIVEVTDCFPTIRTIYAYTLEEATKGIYYLPNATNIVEITDGFPTIRN